MDGSCSPTLPSATTWQRIAPTLATFVLVMLVVGCLYWAQPVLIPVAVAMLLTFMLAPLVSLVQRVGLPRVGAVAVVVSLAAIIMLAALWLVGTQVVQLVSDLPAYQENVAKRVTELRERGSRTLLGNIQRFVNEVSVAATPPPQTPQEADDEQALKVRVVERAAISSIASWLRGLQPVAEPVLLLGGVIVLLIYLLIFREDLRNRLLFLVGSGNLTLSTKALDDASRRISRYLLAQFFLNAGFGGAIAVGLLVLGVPHAILWGFAAGLLRYIPYVGPWLAAILPVTMSLMISEGWWQPLSVVALFAVCEFTSNLIIEPWAYGQSIGVSQAAIIVAVIFWTWLWGAMGMMLAAPLTVCLVVLGKHVPALKFFDVLLGDEPVLTPDQSFYQRLLARDEDEAAEIVRQQAQSLSPVAVCDQVLVPTLVHARNDFGNRLLSSDEYEFVLSAVRMIAEQQDFPAQIAAAKADDSDRMAERTALSVLTCPAKDGVETTALALFQQLLDPRKFRVHQVSAQQLVSEILELVSDQQPAVVCIAALPPGGLAHTRHLCKRLKSRYPQQKIMIGRWGSSGLLEKGDEWRVCGTDYIGTTLEESMSQLEEIAQFLRPATTEPAPPPPPHFRPVTSEAAARA